MKMKRYIAMTLLLCLLVGLTACGSPEPAVSTPAVTNPSSTAGTTSSSEITPTTTVPVTTAPPETTAPLLSYDENGVPIFRFSHCPDELDLELFGDLVSEAKKILDSNKEFHLINNSVSLYFCYHYANYFPERIGDSLSFLSLSDYITIRPSDDPQCRYIQLYLVVLTMVVEKWEDCFVSHHKYYKYQPAASGTYLEGFRGSGYKYAYKYLSAQNELTKPVAEFFFLGQGGHPSVEHRIPKLDPNDRKYILDMELAIANDYLPWTETEQKEIESAWRIRRGEDFPGWYLDGDMDAMLYGVRAYGYDHNGNVVLYVPSESREYFTKTVRNDDMRYFGVGAELLIYKDGDFLPIDNYEGVFGVMSRFPDIHCNIEEYIRSEELKWGQE